MKDKTPMIANYIEQFGHFFPGTADAMAWEVVSNLEHHLKNLMTALSNDYRFSGETAIHKNANIEQGVVLKGRMIISDGVFVGANAYLRGGVFLGPGVSVGPGCEIKTSVIISSSALAHFNFLGDSIVGTSVNMEAGSIVANHHNDREDKTIVVNHGGKLMTTGVTKFGALIGDGSRIGANAVLSPGTLLSRNSIVRRLELVQQT
jgi:UDP-N-acetylglucosamine diphosphorylase / glucose-1-phosphate thymidylyltransferase / UDP-N-acetylgalactosamine diphosphorylase / glucosamine-1-phosphate N-acetyltransferase / galactosamine-1-phosphate N-acetyltransferase